jgi:hypothetical protein
MGGLTRHDASTPLGVSVIEDLKSGDHRRALTALRDILADHLVVAEPNVSAQIAARLQAVLSELDGLAPNEQASASDDIARRREARRAAAKMGQASAV